MKALVTSWDEVSYTFIKKTLPPSLSASPAQHHFALGHSSGSGWTKPSWSGETSANHLMQGFSPIYAVIFSFKQSLTKDGHPLHSLSCTIVLPSFNNQHYLLAFPLFTAPSPYASKICQWISTRQIFLSFKNCITNCCITDSRSFVFIFFYYSKWELRSMTLYYATHMFPLT